MDSGLQPCAFWIPTIWIVNFNRLHSLFHLFESLHSKLQYPWLYSRVLHLQLLFNSFFFPFHENGSKRIRHTFGNHFAILLFQKEEEKEYYIQKYIYIHPTLKRHIYWKYHHLVKELHIHPHKFHCLKPEPSSTKTKVLIDWQKIVRATIV